MVRCKQTDGDYILAVGIGAGGTEITEAEYEQIMAAIRSCPEADGKGYRPPEPEPSDTDELTDAEALDILLGGAT